MSEEFRDDTFLARWLNGELNDEELTSFKASPEYNEYMKIVSGAKNISSSQFDQEELLQKIKEKTDHKERRSYRWMYATAATVVLALSFALYTILTPSTTTVLTSIGEQKTILLPGGSEVTLNANSQIAYTEDTWSDERKITLEGEAYFSVKKGAPFTVESEKGTVTVLGTQFNVVDGEDFYEVKCFEGRVRVEIEGEQEVLKPKNSVRKVRMSALQRRSITTRTPDWMNNKSSFEGVPLTHVFNALKNQYAITYQGDTNFGEQTFTGTFPHDNLQLALKIVFNAIPYDYELKENNVVVILEK